MRYRPHPYQSRAIEWVEEHPRCLLFLDMGLGKSVITLTAIQRLRDHAEVERVLVIAPRKVAESTWSAEAAKWDHLDLRVSVVMGTPVQRCRAMSAEADVYVTSRDTVVWMVSECRGRLPYDMVVIDELTSFKNPRSQRFKALRHGTSGVSRVVGLTGTPTPNGLTDLWAQVYCVDRGERLGRFITRYRQRWFDVYERNHVIIRCTPRPGARDEILGLIGDIALTMRAEDWLTLPPMVETDVRVALPEGVMERYRDFERDCVMEALGGSEGSDRSDDGGTGAVRLITAASAAALAGKLSQFANGAVYDAEGGVSVEHDEKLDALAEIAEGISEGGVLVFYQFRHDRDRILERFAALEPRVYGGARDLEDWNAGRVRMMLAHPASTAFGLNMQAGGSVIVWYSTGWNLELYQQANARLHRQGQRRPVTVYRLVAAGTIDERMAEALGGKAGAQADVVGRLVAGYLGQGAG